MTHGVGHYLAANGAVLEQDLRDSWKRKYFSPRLLGLHARPVPRLLEHASQIALSELHRALRLGATLLLSVPFLACLHEEPHDYFRYARHGLYQMLTGARFQVIEIVPRGSVFRFLGHQVSTALRTSTYRIPVVRELAFLINALTVVLPCYWLDRLPGLRRKMPAGYVAVALKP